MHIKAHLNERMLRYFFDIFSLVFCYFFAFFYLPILTGVCLAFFHLLLTGSKRRNANWEMFGRGIQARMKTLYKIILSKAPIIPRYTGKAPTLLVWTPFYSCSITSSLLTCLSAGKKQILSQTVPDNPEWSGSGNKFIQRHLGKKETVL